MKQKRTFSANLYSTKANMQTINTEHEINMEWNGKMQSFLMISITLLPDTERTDSDQEAENKNR